MIPDYTDNLMLCPEYEEELMKIEDSSLFDDLSMDEDDWSPNYEMVHKEEQLDKLISASLKKVQALQSTARKDERKRVLVVNMLHSLLMQKVTLYKLKMSGDYFVDDSTLINGILQKKISEIGLTSCVRIWVDPPTVPGQSPTIKLPNKAGKKDRNRFETLDE